MKGFSLLIFCFLLTLGVAQPNWPLTKSSATLQVALPSEFGVPVMQGLSVDGWEDGIYISRNGLNLYCIYLPADGLSWILNGAPCNFTPYQKGPTFGMDLITSPTTVCPVWLHGDILISSRSSTNMAFPTWSLSNLNGPVFSEGAPQFTMLNNTQSDIVVYTSNQLPPYNTDIYLIKNASVNPSTSSGTVLPGPVTHTTTEDNPHLERLNANQLVLFFDSPDRVGGVGGLDLWYTTSNDNGVTWATPLQVSSLNTSINEHQPHLYKDNMNQWWLYYCTPDSSGKYAIYRSSQTIPNNWNSWGPKQLVVGPGNTAGIGEPTLTQNGDLSFVVIYQDSNGTPTNKFDADPWFLPRLNTGTITALGSNEGEIFFSIAPNPVSDVLTITAEKKEEPCTILFYNTIGEKKKEVVLQGEQKVDISDLPDGVYFLRINDLPSVKKIIKSGK